MVTNYKASLQEDELACLAERHAYDAQAGANLTSFFNHPFSCLNQTSDKKHSRKPKSYAMVSTSSRQSLPMWIGSYVVAKGR